MTPYLLTILLLLLFSAVIQLLVTNPLVFIIESNKTRSLEPFLHIVSTDFKFTLISKHFKLTVEIKCFVVKEINFVHIFMNT
jgi:hypothetical protein